jgi:hypothetical protein
MQAWTAAELARFLGWAEKYDSDMAVAWHLLAFTGMRRVRLWLCAGVTSI